MYSGMDFDAFSFLCYLFVNCTRNHTINSNNSINSESKGSRYNHPIPHNHGRKSILRILDISTFFINQSSGKNVDCKISKYINRIFRFERGWLTSRLYFEHQWTSFELKIDWMCNPKFGTLLGHLQHILK